MLAASENVGSSEDYKQNLGGDVKTGTIQQGAGGKKNIKEGSLSIRSTLGEGANSLETYTPDAGGEVKTEVGWRK